MSILISLTTYQMQAMERVGAHQSPPPPLAARSMQARSQDKQEGGAEKPALIRAKASAHLLLTPCTASPALPGGGLPPAADAPASKHQPGRQAEGQVTPVQRSEEHSDVETSTASEGSSGGAPWTVVTSPRKGSQDEEVTSPPRAEETAGMPPAEAFAGSAQRKQPAEEAGASGVVLSPLQHLMRASAYIWSPLVGAHPATSVRVSPCAAGLGAGTGKIQAEVAHPCCPGVVAAQSSAANAALDSSAPAKQAAPKSGPQEAAAAAGEEKTTTVEKKLPVPMDDDEDLEISDEEGLAAEGDGSEVDEDWGGDWE